MTKTDFLHHLHGFSYEMKDFEMEESVYFLKKHFGRQGSKLSQGVR